jgi:hypothetical protein
LSGTEYGSITLDVLVGVGVLLAGAGIFIAMLALAKTLARLQTTLDGVDRQVENIGVPATSAMTHVDEVTRSLGETANSLSRTADLTRSAVVPAIVNVGATLGGITAGLRRLVTGKIERPGSS